MHLIWWNHPPIDTATVASEDEALKEHQHQKQQQQYIFNFRRFLLKGAS